MRIEEVVYSVTGRFDTILSTRYFETLEEAVLAVAFIKSRKYNNKCDGIIRLTLSLTPTDALLFRPGGSTWSELTSRGPDVRVREEVECVKIRPEVEENAAC